MPLSLNIFFYIAQHITTSSIIQLKSILYEIFPTNMKVHIFWVPYRCSCIYSRDKKFLFDYQFSNRTVYQNIFFWNFSQFLTPIFFILQKEYRMYTIHKIFLKLTKLQSIYNLVRYSFTLWRIKLIKGFSQKHSNSTGLHFKIIRFSKNYF